MQTSTGVCFGLKSHMCGPGCSKWDGDRNFASPEARWASSHTNAKGQEVTSHLTAVPRGLEGCRTSGEKHAIRATPVMEVMRAVSVSTCAKLTHVSSTKFTSETNLFLQACHWAQYLRRQLQTSDKSSHFQETWDSKGMELADKQLMQPKNFCNAEKGRGDSSDHRPS